MPTFCRHNRFIERCPICSRELPQASPLRPATPGTRSRRSSGRAAGTPAQRAAPGLRVRRESRAVEDGYNSALVPGLRASADAERLAAEIAFSAQRLLAIASSPPGVYADIAAAASRDPDGATWASLLLVYLCPLEHDDAFASIRVALAATPGPGAPHPSADPLPDPDELELGPRTAHETGRGPSTLRAFLEWAQRAGGIRAAFTGDTGWTPERRFERVFERLALPGFGRAGRYDLLVVLGRLRVHDLTPDSLQLGGQRGVASEDPAVLAAKRVFGIADPLLLDRRARALADEAHVPLAALDLALANWGASERATLGVRAGDGSPVALDRIRAALAL